MTIHDAKEKYGIKQADAIRNEGYVYCEDCPIGKKRATGHCPPVECDGYEDAWKAIAKYMNDQQEVDEMVDEEVTETNEPFATPEDIIKHPNHYCRDGALECIEEMILIFGKEVVKHFCLCNIWKYRYRSSDKNGVEDINKSDEYVRIYKRLCSDERTEEDI